MARILLIAKEATANSLRPHLTAAGLEVELRESFRAGDIAVLVDVFDVLVVETRSAGDEMATVRAVRSAGNLVPIVLMADNASDDYCARSLDAGADSVFVQPLSPLVLAAQLHAHVRRSARRGSDIAGTQCNGSSGLCINVGERSIFDDERRVFLTPTENAVIRALAYRQGAYVPTANLLRMVWGEDSTNAHLVASCVRQVRLRLSEFGSAHLLQSRRGYGYRLSKQAIVVTGAPETPEFLRPRRHVAVGSSGVHVE